MATPAAAGNGASQGTPPLEPPSQSGRISQAEKRSILLLVNNALAASDAAESTKVSASAGSIQKSPPVTGGPKAAVGAAIKKATSAKPQNAALYEAAAKKAIDAYGIKPSSFSSISFTEKPTFSGFAATDGARKLSIAPKAFASPGLLASTLHHESVHLQQLDAKRAYWEPEKKSAEYRAGFALNQLEAYDHQLADPARFGLTQVELSQIMFERQNERKRLVEADEELSKANPSHVPYADKLPPAPFQGTKVDSASYTLTPSDAARMKVKP